MANEVFANGRELCCKKGEGKSIAAFPDVCFTPPLTPATPPGVPIPYPNSAMATDTNDGTKTVKITGQEVMLKDKKQPQAVERKRSWLRSEKGRRHQHKP